MYGWLKLSSFQWAEKLSLTGRWKRRMLRLLAGALTRTIVVRRLRGKPSSSSSPCAAGGADMGVFESPLLNEFFLRSLANFASSTSRSSPTGMLLVRPSYRERRHWSVRSTLSLLTPTWRRSSDWKRSTSLSPRVLQAFKNLGGRCVCEWVKGRGIERKVELPLNVLGGLGRGDGGRKGRKGDIFELVRGDSLDQETKEKSTLKRREQIRLNWGNSHELTDPRRREMGD